jgi:DUF1680 family protein
MTRRPFPQFLAILLLASAPSLPATLAQEANLALVATPSASYTSGDTSVDALNDGNEPRDSLRRGTGSYGNWPRRGTQWVQYEWNQPVSTGRIQVYWWDDRRGVRLPRTSRLLYWKDGAFVAVSHASGLGVEGDQFNTTTFDEVTTSRLRLEMDGDGEFSTGILEWRVFDSGKSPGFPPSVVAGVDRVVVVGADTHLAGKIRSLESPDRVRVRWSRQSGPGRVEFGNRDDAATTARFSRPGVYRLQLTAGKGELTGADTLRVKVQQPAAGPFPEPVPTARYTVTSRFWQPRLKSQIVNWIPHCLAKISDPDLPEGGINNFIDAANKLQGKPHGSHRGYVFANAWVFNTIESMCLALMLDARGDEEILTAQAAMKATLEDWIPKILAAQEPDGYLQTAFTLDESRQRWSPRNRADHEGYVAGYFLEAAIAHHLLTEGRDERLYQAAKRLADCWDRHIGPPPRQEWYDGHQAMELALVRFGRHVNEVEGANRGRKYIDLARFLLDCRAEGSEYDQSHVPVVQQYEAVGHAVRAVYSYAAMADVVLETGDPDYQGAVMSLYDNIVNRKYYVTGGVGSGETSEGFGPDYSLRHNAYCESCSSCGEIFFQHKLNRIHRDGRYADLYEETLYNALLGSMDLEGRSFYYQNPLDSGRPRYDWHGCPCCVGNIPRTLLSLPTWMYVKAEDGIHVNLFIGSRVTLGEVAGTKVELVQNTDYPWDGRVELIVNPEQARRFSIRLRLPDRDVSELYTASPEADGIPSQSIKVNGSAVEPKEAGGYAVISRSWEAGDRVEFTLPMRVQRVHGSPRIEATQGRVALRYGPLIYNVERIDQDIDQALAPDAPLGVKWREDLLGGVLVIEGQWADGTPLLAIPNYARNNRVSESQQDRRGDRGPSSMVWFKEAE